MEPVKYKAIKYIRLSSADDKQGESDSVTNQRKIIDEWLRNHPEIEVAAEKVEDAVIIEPTRRTARNQGESEFGSFFITHPGPVPRP